MPGRIGTGILRNGKEVCISYLRQKVYAQYPVAIGIASRSRTHMAVVLVQVVENLVTK